MTQPSEPEAGALEAALQAYEAYVQQNHRKPTPVYREAMRAALAAAGTESAAPPVIPPPKPVETKP